jgi:hypothetical protein
VLRATNLAAGTYTLFVDGAGTASGSYTLDIYIDPTGGVSGERCSRPIFWATGTASQTGTTCGFDDDMGGVGCEYSGSGDAPDVVYYVVVPATRTVSFSSCTTGCTNYDSTLSLRSVCNATATLACRDDGCRSGCAGALSSRQSSISASLAPGIYYFAVDGYSSACGSYVVAQTGL